MLCCFLAAGLGAGYCAVIHHLPQVGIIGAAVARADDQAVLAHRCCLGLRCGPIETGHDVAFLPHGNPCM
jgi:hypothetical protein